MLAQRLHQPYTTPCQRAVRVKGLVVRGDASARVRGDARRVHRWLSDVRHWNTFYPGKEFVGSLVVQATLRRLPTLINTFRNAAFPCHWAGRHAPVVLEQTWKTVMGWLCAGCGPHSS